MTADWKTPTPDELAAISKREDVNPDEGENKYGDVKFADEKNKKYPIDTPEHIRAAWNYINKPGNAGKYDSGEVATIKHKIIAAWKAKIDKSGPPSVADNHSVFIVDTFVSVKAGEPYRLLPFGTITKNGRSHVIDAETAAKFRLPHFQPPIKLGSHDEVTPAGGHIVGLEVRQDGLYAIPEYTDKGAAALADGAYKYQSPEIIWEGGGIEDSITGNVIPGPLIVGDALLHVPALGKEAAMYEAHFSEEVNNMPENVTIPQSLLDQFMALFKADKHDSGPAPVITGVKPEEFEAVKTRADELEAKIQTLEAAAERKTKIESFAAVLKAAKVPETGAEILAGMTKEQADWVVTQFKALSAQVNDSALLGEVGSSGAGADADPEMALNAAITAEMKASKTDYNSALAIVRDQKPDLFSAVFGKKGG